VNIIVVISAKLKPLVVCVYLHVDRYKRLLGLCMVAGCDELDHADLATKCYVFTLS